MHNYLCLIAIASLFPQINQAQTRYAGEELRDYYEWFHEYSQTADQFVSGTSLVTFIDQAPIRQSPSHEAQVVSRLPIAHTLSNVALPLEEKTVTTLNGYSDNWLLVSGCDEAGKGFNGYIWGGFVAKGYRYFDLNANSENDMVLFGLSQKNRNFDGPIAAAIRVIIDGELKTEQEIEGFCVFEDCSSSTMLRVLNSPASAKGHLVLEASVLTSGCLAGVDKSYVSWDGQMLEVIYQAEFSTGYEYADEPMVVPAQENKTQICYFSHEDATYNPVWTCEVVTSSGRAIREPGAVEQRWARP